MSEGQESDNVAESMQLAPSSLAAMMNSSAENETSSLYFIFSPSNTLERRHICTRPVCKLICSELEPLIAGALCTQLDNVIYYDILLINCVHVCSCAHYVRHWYVCVCACISSCIELSQISP